MNRWPVRVVKVGGSLLEFELLPTRLAMWLIRQPPAHNVLIAGGGSLVETIRVADQRFALGEAASHSLCLDAMRVTARLLRAVLSQSREPTIAISMATGLVMLKTQLATSTTVPLTILFDAGDFMQREDANFPPNPLPQYWDVTSDSIAARVATLVAAEELVLLKSATPPTCTRHAAAETGFVDRYFSQASIPIAIVRVVNLRSASFEEALLRS